jgi:hypothetical protein
MLFIDKNLLFQGPARCLNFTFSYMKIIYEKVKNKRALKKLEASLSSSFYCRAWLAIKRRRSRMFLVFYIYKK